MEKIWKKLVCALLAISLLLAYPAQAAKADGGTIEDFVTRLYTLCLNRTPDEDGLNDWCTLLFNGSYTGTQVAHGFVFSDEFIASGYSDEEFVQQMYRIFLGREYDQEGMGTWLGLMQNSGYGREAIFNGFSQSVEFGRICTDYGIEQGGAVGKVADDISSFVIRFYQVFLGRGADPSGLQTWTTALKNKTMSAAEVAQGFVFSDEFLSKNYDDATFVKYMYTAFLDRGADEEGLQTWTDCLKNGWTREQVFDGFVDSNEFARICEEYGISPDGTNASGVKIEEAIFYGGFTEPISCGGDVIITRSEGMYGAMKTSGEIIVENKYESWWVMNEEGMTAFQLEDTVYCYDAEGNMIHSIERPVSVNISEGYILYTYSQENIVESMGGRKITLYPLVIYDIGKKLQHDLDPHGDESWGWSAMAFTPVKEGKFYIGYESQVEGKCTEVYEVNVSTLKMTKIESEKGYWINGYLAGMNGDYGVQLATNWNSWCYGVGITDKTGVTEQMVMIEDLIAYANLNILNFEYYTCSYIENGQHFYNIDKQTVVQVIDATTREGKYFLLDFSDAILGKYTEYDDSLLKVTNISDIVKAQYDYISLSTSGNYLACDGDNWFYINAKGEKIADYVDCSDFVGDYALIIDEDGFAYVVDTEFNKVSEGYPADSVQSVRGALCINKDGKRTLLYVGE